MKKESYIKVLAIALITTSVYSCSFFKELTNNDIETETEEDFIFEEILSETHQPIKKLPSENQPAEKPTNKSKMNIPLCDKDNEKLYAAIEQWYGTPYKGGGCTKEGVDCSCFTINIFQEVYNIKLNRRAMDMVQNIKLIDRKDLVEGDLVFFTNSKGRINHVGIYLKENMFAHASSSKGVIVSKLTEKYWDKRFYKGGRHNDVSTKWR
jgi:lipoprotein Spr